MKPTRPHAAHRPWLRACLWSLLAAVSWTLPAFATSWVAIEDGDLFDQADLVAEITVLHKSPAFRHPAPVTEHVAQVDRVLKGAPSTATVLLRTPGGVSARGDRLVVPGSPALPEGARSLVFLSRHRDGSFSPLHLGLGSFMRRPSGSGLLAVRRLGHAVLLDESLEPTFDRIRDYDRFVEWLADRGRGRNRLADYYVDRSALARAAAPFNLMESDDKNVRWFEFDQDGSVPWRVHSADSQGTEPEFEAALAAWSLAPVRLEAAGATAATSGFQNSDGVNAIIFGDPNNEVAGAYSCEDGGTLASGGWWQRQETGDFQGETYVRLIEADIVVNDGTECLLQASRSGAAEMFTHELGHTLGIAHSCGEEFDQTCSGAIRNGATMRGSLHNDGRGAEIRLDDAAALAALYGTPAPPAIETAPDELVAKSKKARVARLSWRDNSTGEGSFEIWGRSAKPQFELLATEPADSTTAKLKQLAPGEQYEFKVRARIGDLVTLFSPTQRVTMPAEKLRRPKRLRARASSPTSGTLTWKDRSSSEIRFQIQRRVDGGRWRSWRSAPAQSTSLDFDDGASGVSYEFRVRARKPGEKSDFSNIATLTMP